MNKHAVLAHDIGTSSVKSSVIYYDGSLAASNSTKYNTILKKNGYVEQNPEDWWDCVCKNTRKILSSYPELKDAINSIGVSGHMLGCLPVDSNGKALSNSIIHSDTRAFNQFEKVDSLIGKDNMYSMTGNILEPRSTLCKILWFKENKNEIYKSACFFHQSKDYITSRLTGNPNTTDYSDASHAQLIDINKKQYIYDVFDELEIDKSKLPDINPSTKICGKLTKKSADRLGLKAGIPVIAGGGDGACASVGAGAVNINDIYGCFGTTAWISRILGKPYFDKYKRIFNVICIDGENYNACGTVQAAGSTIEWVKHLFDVQDYETLNSLAKKAPAGSENLVFLPCIEGERTPHFDSKAKGVYFGISSVHKKKHFIRAAYEGVSYALNNVLDIIKETGSVSSLPVIGGGARSDILLKILASVINLDLYILGINGEDITSLGVAAAALVGTGVYKTINEAVKGIKTSDVVLPDGSMSRKYANLYKIYNSLYPSLKDVFIRDD